MKKSFFIILSIILLLLGCKNKTIQPKENKIPYAIVIHGGAGNITPENFPKSKQKEYKAVLNRALEKGYAVLEKGGTSIEAVQQTIVVLEDSPLFNAGKGAVFDSEGKNRLDASIMDGKTLNAGAVAGVSNIKNPILLAKTVMDKSKHVLLSGIGAEKFAEQNHIQFEDDSYFYTKRQADYLKKVQKREREERLRSSVGSLQSSVGSRQSSVGSLQSSVSSRQSSVGSRQSSVSSRQSSVSSNQSSVGSLQSSVGSRQSAVGSHELVALEGKEKLNSVFKIQNLKFQKYGTVGCVALDKKGNITAGTSTGGLTNKKFGRIGDSPLIGAGTYANNATCGVSCTGVGEYFIRTLAAHEVSNLIQYKNFSAKAAIQEVIHTQIVTLGGVGGMIVLDNKGNIAWDFNTNGMFRAYKKSTGENETAFFKEKTVDELEE